MGACFLSPTPAGPIKACSLGGPALGMAMDVVDAEGRSVRGQVGELVCRKPLPGMTRGFWRDPERYIETYWSRFPGVWVHGDWASVDEDGFWFLHGRSDDTLNIAGKRIGPAEIESAAVSHPAVSEAAAIGVPHEVKGEVAWVFCILLPDVDEPTAELAAEVADAVGVDLGRAFKPDRVVLRDGAAEDAQRQDHAPGGAGEGARPRPRRPVVAREPGGARRDRAGGGVSDRLDGQVVLVTGGGRGIGRGIAVELAGAGARVAVSARTRAQVEEVAREVGGLAVEADVSDRTSVDAMVAAVERELGPVDALVSNAGINLREDVAWDADPDAWWRVFEVNVLGAYLCARAVIPGMLERGRGRIVHTGSGASYLPGLRQTAYPSSKAALGRFAETLASQLADTPVRVFVISPGLVRTDMTGADFPDDAPWTPPELAPRLVLALLSGRADALAGRYLHAEHDDIDELIARADAIRADDLNAIRLRR